MQFFKQPSESQNQHRKKNIRGSTKNTFGQSSLLHSTMAHCDPDLHNRPLSRQNVPQPLRFILLLHRKPVEHYIAVFHCVLIVSKLCV